MSFEKYKLKNIPFVANVNLKTKNGIYGGKIYEFFEKDSCLYGIIQFFDESKTPILNIEKLIESNLIEIKNYSGDLVEYIKNLSKKSQKKSYDYECCEENNEFEKIESLLLERNIKSLIHFTNVKNLKSILEYGICSKEFCLSNNIAFFASDSKRLDGLTNYVSFSFEFPNYLMFCSKKTSTQDYVVLEVDASILKNYGVRERKFSTNNAAANENKIGGKFKFLEDMFGNIECRQQLSIPSNYTTNPQAEVLLKERIPSQYIKKIHTNDFGVYDDILKYVDSSIVELNSKYFSPRCDWEYWKNKENNNGEKTGFYNEGYNTIF